MDKYLIKYLRDNAENELSRKYIDFFKTELDWHIYNSETHITKSYHRNHVKSLRQRLIHLIQYSSILSFNSNLKYPNNINVLSTVFFPEKNTLLDLGFNLYSPVWNALGWRNIFGDIKTIYWHRDIQNLIRNKHFYQYLDLKLHNKLEAFQNHLLLQYKKQDFKALFLNTDQYFYSKYNIDIFRKMDRPSFVFSHGLPGIYSLEVDNRADSLMVWGEKIKQNYIDAGFSSSKIKVVGSPKHKNLVKKKLLRSDLSDILIIPISSVTWHQHEYNETVLTDKSMVVLYLYKIQSVLRKLGLKKARYRVHPSINKQWVHEFLDQDFYIPDSETLSSSLNRSSLVIGAASTVMLESLIHGVNYVVFDPKDENGINLANYKSVPPFDGSEKKLMISNDEIELENMLRDNVMTDYSLVHDYIQDFDLTVLKEIIN